MITFLTIAIVAPIVLSFVGGTGLEALDTASLEV